MIRERLLVLTHSNGRSLSFAAAALAEVLTAHDCSGCWPPREPDGTMRPFSPMPRPVAWWRVPHHVARSELLYAASFDEALPEDPAARYTEAMARFGERLVASRATGGDPSIVFPDPYGTFFAPGEVVAEVLALERELVSQAT